MLSVVEIIISVSALGAVGLAIKSIISERRIRSRYSGIVDVETAVAAAAANAQKTLEALDADERTKRESLNKEYVAAVKEFESWKVEEHSKRDSLSREYSDALKEYERLKAEVSSFEVKAEDISYGLYQPQFTFTTPEAYKRQIEQVRAKQKELIRAGEAIICPVEWHVGNSRREGQRMVKLNMKLAMRAFNGECDAAVADVSWANISKMEDRVVKAYDSINKLGEVLSVRVTAAYLNLKLDELRLKHELEEKKYHDREEQRRIREQIREEERANREIEQAQSEAETEEYRFREALDRAREDAAAATGGKLEKLIEQVSKFEAKLDEARKKKERAIARAQLTKSGFVYVISNIGSFGEKVFKIGMTRRLEPMDRIYELSGASVPFPFDLHAMLYSDNAPELEGALHRHFEARRLNLVNARREFYHGVELTEIEEFARGRGLSSQFIEQAEAREYRQTSARRTAPLTLTKNELQPFAAQLFEIGKAH